MNTFKKYKALIEFGLEGLSEPIKKDEEIILPEVFGSELVTAGSVVAI